MALSGGFSADFPRFTREQLFAIATDVERYPAFIPWCKSARVLMDDGGLREVDNHYGAGPADLAFRSRAVATPPDRLEITSTDGPFRRFSLTWTFTDLEQGCRVRADYVVDFRSGLLQGLARLTIREVERRVLKRFRDRAAELYGR
ncbi:MAG TPA: type II toxin-antitoxin system RatA family toxin [Candidatus Omnitrophota bacterium]|nr:type II toxin-antitoxin system RatA family toxin [Candidatus Omnitrophota bacterium]